MGNDVVLLRINRLVGRNRSDHLWSNVILRLVTQVSSIISSTPVRDVYRNVIVNIQCVFICRLWSRSIEKPRIVLIILLPCYTFYPSLCSGVLLLRYNLYRFNCIVQHSSGSLSRPFLKMLSLIPFF